MAYRNRGDAWSALGERSKAEDDYSRAIRLAPPVAPSNLELATDSA
jgi:hypothetical protein